MLFVSAGASQVTVVLAWLYVGLRIVHSAIHLSYNHVIHRLAVFALSSVVLLALWVQAGWHLASNPVT